MRYSYKCTFGLRRFEGEVLKKDASVSTDRVYFFLLQVSEERETSFISSFREVKMFRDSIIHLSHPREAFGLLETPLHLIPLLSAMLPN